jgi:hypothetical protein
MTLDPIVAEVRARRAEVMKACGYDLDRFVERLRQYQLEHPERLVTKEQLDERRARAASARR